MLDFLDPMTDLPPPYIGVGRGTGLSTCSCGSGLDDFLFDFDFELLHPWIYLGCFLFADFYDVFTDDFLCPMPSLNLDEDFPVWIELGVTSLLRFPLYVPEVRSVRFVNPPGRSPPPFLLNLIDFSLPAAPNLCWMPLSVSWPERCSSLDPWLWLADGIYILFGSICWTGFCSILLIFLVLLVGLRYFWVLTFTILWRLFLPICLSSPPFDPGCFLTLISVIGVMVEFYSSMLSSSKAMRSYSASSCWFLSSSNSKLFI